MFALWKKTLGSTVRENWMSETHTMPSGISPISSGNGRKFNYVCKAGAIDGPWTSEDDQEEDSVIPDDLKVMGELFLFQAQIVEWATKEGYEERKVRVIVDEEGGQGKTKMKRFLQFHHRKTICIIPPMQDPKDIARLVFSLRKPTTSCYVIDIPRACTDPKALRKLYSAIESLKDGGCWDDRFKGRQIMFTPPRILVLTNRMPDLSWMSKDRWVIFNIVDKGLLDVTEKYIKKTDEPSRREEEIKLPNPGLAAAMSSRPYFRMNEQKNE